VAEVIQESTQDEFLKLEHPGKIFWWKSINAREKRYNHTYSIVKTKEVGEEPQREVYQDPFQDFGCFSETLILGERMVRDHLGPSYMEALSHIDSVERLRAATRRVKTMKYILYIHIYIFH